MAEKVAVVAVVIKKIIRNNLHIKPIIGASTFLGAPQMHLMPLPSVVVLYPVKHKVILLYLLKLG